MSNNKTIQIELKKRPEKLQKQYIIERMEKYLMKYDIYDLIELYIDVKDKSVKKEKEEFGSSK